MNRLRHSLPGLLLGCALLAACGPPESKAEQLGADLKAEAEQLGNQAKQSATDIALATRVRAALTADEQLKLMPIEVDANSGRVSLKGTVPDLAARRRASRLALGIEGVTGVDNRLQALPKS